MGLISGIVRDRAGDTLAGATVNIYDAGTATPITLYSDAALTTPTTNPMTSDADGIFLAYAADGLYKWEVVRPGYPTEAVDNVPSMTPANYALLAGRSGGQHLALDTATGATTGYITSTAHATKGKWFLNAAGTITVNEASTLFGVGTATPSTRVHAYSGSNATNEVRAETGSTGTLGVGQVRAMSTTGNAMLSAFSSGYSGSLFGTSLPGVGVLYQDTGNGLLVGTQNNAKVVLGTQNVERLSISGAGVGVWNDGGADNDFRMEGDTDANLFFLDASADMVGFGTNAPATKSHVASSANAAVESRVETTSTGTASAAHQGVKSSTATALLSAFGTGQTGTLFGITLGSYVSLSSSSGTGFLMGTSHNARVVIGTQNVERLSISGVGDGVWNDTGADADLRFEGDTDQNLFRLDAGSDRASFGAAAVQSVALAAGVGPFVLVNHAGNYGLTVSRATGADANPASFTFWKTRASAPETKTAVVDQDNVGRFLFQAAADGTTAHSGAQLLAYVDGTPATSRVPMGLAFGTATTAADVATALNIRSSGVLEVPRMHNNGGTTAATAAISSGTYTPTITNVANVAASTARATQWIRVGNVVTVAGEMDIDPTAVAQTTWGVSLPVPSALASTFQLGGVGVQVYGGGATYAISIRGDATNDRAQFDFGSPQDTANRTVTFSFQYVVV